MQIKVKSFGIEMDVKSKGIEFEVRKPDGSSQIGDCYLTSAGLTWCKGKTSKANGVTLSWNALMAILKSKEARKAAVKAAKAT